MVTAPGAAPRPRQTARGRRRAPRRGAATAGRRRPTCGRVGRAPSGDAGGRRGRGGVAARGGDEGPAGGGDHALDAAAVEAAQAALLEPGDARMVGLHRGADALQRGDDALPGVGDAGRVGGDEAQGRAAGERLPQPQAGADAVGLGGGGGLADQGLAADLGSEREWARGEGFAAAGGDRELEAWEKDADDHVEHMFASASDGFA